MPKPRVSYPRINDARAVVEAEHEVLQREIDALESFRAQLRRLEATTASGQAGSGGPVATVSVQGIAPAALARAYRETVLAMDHYDREYGEPLLEHVEREFGAELRAVFASDRPIPAVQRDLVDRAVADAIDRRERVDRSLVRELDSLDEAAERLGEIERRFHAAGGVDAADGELDALRGACEALAGARQEAIHHRPTPRISGIGDRSLVAYLYGERAHRFPVLVELADLAEAIREGIDCALWDGE